jgi:hypothetical protein
MISSTSQCREVKVLWVLLTGVLCLFTPIVSLGAQAEQPCAPEKNFAKVGYLLEKKDQPALREDVDWRTLFELD